MISVEEALAKVLALVEPGSIQTVGLREADGRVLAQDVQATRDQPPFSASAMDGYAITGGEPEIGAVFDVIGEAAAGHRSDQRVGSGQAVRIFTGAPVPKGADFVVIQEDVTREGDQITISHATGPKSNIRPAGGDFKAGDIIAAPKRLRPADLALLAAMNIAEVPVTKRPEIAILATGDELVMPGESPGPDQIIASNIFGLKALVERAGGHARLLPIARDSAASLEMAFELAKGADLLVTVGGASVGDHDLVGQVAQSQGLQRAFYKVAMRPGKPLMAGHMGEIAMLGLPGNPVSAMVCGEVFLAPMLDKMLGLPAGARPRTQMPLGAPLRENGPREHYMRADIRDGRVFVAESQDSSLLSVLSAADALVVRAPNAPALQENDMVEVLRLNS